MAKEITTAKQSSGAGFLFEDKVFSWFAVSLLSKHSPFSNISAEIEKIFFQARAEGWLLDDLVLRMKNLTGDEFSIAISVKSNVQFSGNGPNSSLLSDLWEQYLNTESNIFNTEQDYLCIVNSVLNSDLSRDINKLIKAAQTSTEDLLEARILKDKKGSFSESQIKILKGFRCPKELASKHSIENKAVWKLLSRIILLEFDFENASSKDENQLRKQCKSLLLKANSSHAEILFNKLCETRSELAANEGAFIDYKGIVNRLRHHFKLKGILNHEEDWKKIDSNTTSKINSIRDELGGKIRLERKDDLDKFNKDVQENQFTFLLGKSGFGKSVFLKHFSQDLLLKNTKVIWIDSDIIESNNLSGYFELSNNFIDLIRYFQDQVGYIIIDSIERFRKDEHLKLLFNLLSYIKKNETPWKVFFSCQTDDFDDVLRRFYRVNLSILNKVFYLEAIENKQLSLVLEEFPALSELFKHDHLKEILTNLKYLDLLAFNLSKESSLNLSKSFGESDIIDLIWKEEVEHSSYDNGDQRSSFLQLISDFQGEKMSVRIPQSVISVADLTPLPSLKSSKILKSINDKLEFEHDLFSEWARYKLIRSNEDDFKIFIVSKNILSPLWCKSIRLYGVYLLEKNESIDDWIKAFTDLNENIPKEKIIQDSLLEAIIYSNSALKFLNLLFDFFIQDEGKILNRFLSLFLIKATRPNPQVLELAKEIGGYSESELSTYHRIPMFLYWPPVIKFIKKNINAFIPLAVSNIADFSQTWLDFTPRTFSLRKDVAMFAYKNAEWIFNKLQKGSVSDGIDKKVYKAMLSSVNEMPDEIIELCLKLCRRVKFEKPKKEKSNSPRTKSFFTEAEIRKPIQWKNGPFERVDEAFSKISLTPNGLSELIILYPEKAKEIILALLIDPPKPISFSYGNTYKYDIREPHGWYTSYYGQGPFLKFLNSHPLLGIETIISLVDFASEQWAAVRKYNKNDNSSLSIRILKTSKEFIGDERTYFWYRSSGNAPKAVSCALMALEKFLIDEIDNKNDVKQYVEYILVNAKSVSFIGLLSFIGKYQPSLFLNVLSPLLSTFELYKWEINLNSIEGHQMILSYDLDEQLWNEVREWNNLEQRKINLYYAGIQLYLRSDNLDDFYKETIEVWRKELKNDEKHGEVNAYKRNLIAQFNKENYKIINIKGQSYYQYDEPKKLQEKLAPLRFDNEFLDKTISPFKYLKEIEEGKKYSKEEVFTLWEKVLIDSNIPLTPEKYHFLSNDLSSIFGAIALLFEHESLWADEHPEYISWTIDYTEKVLINAPNNLNELYMASGNHSWDAFIATFLPKIWVKDLKNKKIRKSLGLLCLKSTYDTDEILFRNVSSELNWSDKNFIQLQNLIIQWSLGVYRFFGTENQEELPRLKKKALFQRFIDRFYKSKNSHEEPWINVFGYEILTDFINDKTAMTIINWSESRMIKRHVNHNSWSPHKSKENNRKLAGLDTQMLQHVFSSIPNLVDIDEDSEYQYVLILWDQLIEQLVFENGVITPNCEDIDEYPDDFSLWLLRRISNQIVYIKKENQPSKYWKPILNYGAKAPYQVNIFLEEFFINSISEKDNNRFLEEWKLMTDFCSNNENWINGAVIRRVEFEHSLYGVSKRIMSIWDKENSLFLENASELIIAWFTKNIYKHDVISRLIILLRKKSGIVLLKQGLQVLSEFIKLHSEILSKKAPKESVHRKFEDIESLAKTASYLWEYHKDKIKGSSDVFESFKDIVTYLVSANEPIGVELQSRLLE